MSSHDDKSRSGRRRSWLSLSDEERKQAYQRLFGSDPPNPKPLRYAVTTAQVAIPDPLQSFLATVHRMIEVGDEATKIPSDDLLQDQAVCGGLNSKTGYYDFTYFPEPERGSEVTWDFSVSAELIRAIAVGEATTLTVRRRERLP